MAPNVVAKVVMEKESNWLSFSYAIIFESI